MAIVLQRKSEETYLSRNGETPPPTSKRGGGRVKTLISKSQVVLPGFYLLYVGCQGFLEPEPAKAEPLPQGLQSLRQTNNTQPKLEIHPNGSWGNLRDRSHTPYTESPSLQKSWGRYTCSSKDTGWKGWTLPRNRGLQRKSPSTSWGKRFQNGWRG